MSANNIITCCYRRNFTWFQAIGDVKSASNVDIDAFNDGIYW